MDRSLTELAARIVAAQASHVLMSSQDLTEALKGAFTALKDMKEMEEADPSVPYAAPHFLGLDPKKSIRQNKVICLECGKEFRMLTNKHLKHHGITAKEYRKKYGFGASEALSARSLNAVRRENALQRAGRQVLKAIPPPKEKHKKVSQSQLAAEKVAQANAMGRPVMRR